MATVEPVPGEERTQLSACGAAQTDVGRRRSHNEDQVLVSDTLGLYAVADGMGGHDAGDVASAIVSASIEEYFWADAPVLAAREQDAELPAGARRLISAVHYANREVYTTSGRSAQQGGMGSTVVAVFVEEQEQLIHICHVGDSRCYRYRDGELALLTADHSMINEALRLNPNLSQEILKQLPTNVVTRALGTKELVRPDVRSEALRDDDLYLLCSDGLNGEVSDDDLAFALTETEDLADTCELLINMANDAGGRDNVSAVLIRIGKRVPPPALAEEIDEAEATTLLDARAAPREEPAPDSDSLPTLAMPRSLLGDTDVMDAEEVTRARRRRNADTDVIVRPKSWGADIEDEEDSVEEDSVEEDSVEIDIEVDEEEQTGGDNIGRRARRSREIAAATARLDAALDELAAFDGWASAPAETPSGSGHLLIVPEPDDEYDDVEDDVQRETSPFDLIDRQPVIGTPIIKIGTIPPGAAAPSDDDFARCLACGHKLAARERFCGMCGLSCDEASAGTCHQCDKPLLEDTRYCVWCGSRVDAGSVRSTPAS